MIAADTNLVIRHLTGDDAAQFAAVSRLFAEVESRREQIFLSCIVVCEATWVLARTFDFDKRRIAAAVEFLLSDGSFVFEQRPLVERALAEFKRLSGQFADHLIGVIAAEHDCSTTYTFEKALARSENFTVLK